jgi:V/A-type H+-transporting ATPase subunit G/H
MAKEAVEKVKKAEEEARSLIDDARNKSDSIVKQAYKDAEESYKKIITEAKAEANSIKVSIINEAHEEAENILDSANIEANKLNKIDIGAAVNIIVDRIVKPNVNS